MNAGSRWEIFSKGLWGLALGTLMLSSGCTGGSGGGGGSDADSEFFRYVVAIDDGQHGAEPWFTDGTPEGTYMPRDINIKADAYGVGYTKMVSVGDMTYFNAFDPDFGNELWKTDGTEAGTVMLKDIAPGKADSSPNWFTVIGSTVYFGAFDPEHGHELWKTDGTEAGTVIVKDINPGTGDSYPASFTMIGENVFFSARDSTNGMELWVSDGTEAGTVMLKDIAPGASSSQLDWFVPMGDTLFFAASTTGTYAERTLWKSDGTPGGTVEISPENVWAIAVAGSTLYFRGSDTTYGHELWKSDGTAAGTVLVKDILPGTSSSTPSQFVAMGSTLYFVVFDGGSFAIWKSDGSATGTVMVTNTPISPRYLTVAGASLYFSAQTQNGGALWKSDGTGAGTVVVKDGFWDISTNSAPWIYNLTPWGDYLAFTCDDGIHGQELWRTDGTESGTVMVKDIHAGAGSSSPHSARLYNVGGTLYFDADDGIHGSELWKSDGTDAGTLLLKDINKATETSLARFDGGDSWHATRIGGTYFFPATDGVNGNELWKSDGTEAGTVMVKDIATGAADSNPEAFTVFGDALYFTANDGISGLELWKSDGTKAGTVMVADITTGEADTRFYSRSGSYAAALVPAGDFLYFAADDGVNGTTLWKSDGTAVGTTMVDPSLRSVSDLVALGDTLYFYGDNSTVGAGLWKSDGTSVDFVVDIYPASLTAVGDTLYFLYDDSIHGSELWKSDGTKAGTVLAEDINPGAEGSNALRLTAVGSTLYFFADDGQHGRQLWKGTESGVQMFQIWPGTQSAHFVWSTVAVGDVLYFSVDDDTHGVELWQCDGSSAGLVKDINAGPESSVLFMDGTYYGEVLFFAMSHDGVGLWASDGTAEGTRLIQETSTQQMPW